MMRVSNLITNDLHLFRCIVHEEKVIFYGYK